MKLEWRWWEWLGNERGGIGLAFTEVDGTCAVNGSCLRIRMLQSMILQWPPLNISPATILSKAQHGLGVASCKHVGSILRFRSGGPSLL